MSDRTSDAPGERSFFSRHEFAIRRLHSLTGIVPLGLYMVVHLATNASLLNGPETFQRAVFAIHSPGKLLPLIEWGFIFLPLIFHAGVGIWISREARYNTSHYRFANNRRYAWQRWTGLVGLVYLFLHIMHLHGGFHADWWMATIDGVGFGQFRPYNAGSSLIYAMNLGYGILWPAIYLVGILSLVYHFTNGIWTAGITWGLWVSPKAQLRATKVCVALGALLTVLSLAAWSAATFPGPEDAAEMRLVEDRMYEFGVKAGTVSAMEEKRDMRGREEDATETATSDSSDPNVQASAEIPAPAS